MPSCHDRPKKGVGDDFYKLHFSEVFQSSDHEVLLQNLLNNSHVALHQLMFHTDGIYSSSIMLPTNEATIELQLVVLSLHPVFENSTVPRFANSNLSLPVV